MSKVTELITAILIYDNSEATIKKLALEAYVESVGVITKTQVAVFLPSVGPDPIFLPFDSYNVAKACFQAGQVINGIKEIRTVTGLGLKDAKDLIESGQFGVRGSSVK